MSTFDEEGGRFRGKVAGKFTEVYCNAWRDTAKEAMDDAGRLMFELEAHEASGDFVVIANSANSVVKILTFTIEGKWFSTFKVASGNEEIIPWGRLEHTDAVTMGGASSDAMRQIESLIHSQVQ